MLIDAPPIYYWNSNPYTVAFSPDGSTLAIGSGGWYGNGGLTLVDTGSARSSSIRFLDDLGSRGLVDLGGMPVADFDFGGSGLTVSGLAFDADGQSLAACTWGRRQHGGPTFLFRVTGQSLEHRETFGGPDWQSEPAPTGLLLTGGRIHTRNAARKLEEVFTSHELPADVNSYVSVAHRSHARVIHAGNELLTGGGGSLSRVTWTPQTGWDESQKVAAGLVVGLPARGVATPGSRVTSILAHPDGTIITGGLEGELLQWEHEGDWRVTGQIRAEQPGDARRGATYFPQSVIGLCALADGRFYSVDAGGEVLEWSDGVSSRSFKLPREGSPRSIAVHPDTLRGPMIAVAVKAKENRGLEHKPGYTVCFSLD